MCAVGINGKDVPTAIRKVLWCCSHLVWLRFLRFHPYMLLQFLKWFCDLFLLFCGGKKSFFGESVINENGVEQQAFTREH